MFVEALSGAFVSRQHLELEHPHFPVPYGSADPRFTGGRGSDWKPVLRASAATASGLPMTALLSQALVAFAIEYEDERRGPIQWAANVLQGVDGRRAESTTGRGPHGIGNLERLGIVAVDREGVAELTSKGRAMRDAYEPVSAAIEIRWRDRFGSSLLDDVAGAIRVEGDWPRFPVIAWTGAEFSVVT